MNADECRALLAEAERLARRAAETADAVSRHGGSLDEREGARLDAAAAQALAAVATAGLLHGAVVDGKAGSIGVWEFNS